MPVTPTRSEADFVGLLLSFHANAMAVRSAIGTLRAARGWETPYVSLGGSRTVGGSLGKVVFPCGIEIAVDPADRASPRNYSDLTIRFRIHAPAPSAHVDMAPHSAGGIVAGHRKSRGDLM